MITIIMFTRHDMTEKPSKEGQTVISENYAYIYLNNEKCTFRTPTDWKRYFKDTKEGWLTPYFNEGGLDFLCYKEDGSVDLSIFIPDYYVYDIESIAAMSDDEKQELKKEITGDGDPAAKIIKQDNINGRW